MENYNRLSQWYPVAWKSMNLLKHYEEIRIAVKALEIKFRHSKHSAVWVPIMCFPLLFKMGGRGQGHPLLGWPKWPKLHKSQRNHADVRSQRIHFSYGNALFAFWMFSVLIKSYSTRHCVLWAILNNPNLALSYFVGMKLKWGIKFKKKN